MDNKYIVMYRVRKYLKIFSFALLFLLIGLLIFEYIRVRPKDVYFTNVTSSSVTVSWTTKSALPGVVLVEEDKSLLPISILGIGKEKSYDTRDSMKAELEAVSSTSDNAIEKGIDTLNIEDFEKEIVVKEKGDYYTHHVVVTGLDPEKEYSFKIGDNLLFTTAKDIKDIATVKTLSVPEGIDTPEPAYGTITDAQNTEGIPINLQTPVTDAVVYLNFIDNETGKRSNVFSSSVNSSGSWYMDVSGAVDDQGNPFLETYDSVIENVYAEIYIDAGPLGKWSKIESSNWITPVSWSVLNMPNAIEQKGEPGSLIRVDEPNASVKGLLTSQVSAGFIECDSTCGTWDVSANKCICPSGMKVNSSGGCVCVSGTFNPSNCSCTTYTPPDETIPTPPPAPDPVCGGKAVSLSATLTTVQIDGWNKASYCSVGDASYKPTLPDVGKSVSWNCVSGGASKTCTATRAAATPPSCGSRAGNYSWDETDWKSGTSYCSPGEATSSPAFPAQGDTASWTCTMNSLNVQCKASRQGLINPSKETCTERISWCGDCYYKDQNDLYVKCDSSLCTKPPECFDTVPADQEKYTCSPSGTLYKSCTSVSGQCLMCQWAQIVVGGSYGAKWVPTGNESCLGFSDQVIEDCTASAAQIKCEDSFGTWENNTCKCAYVKNLKLQDGACVCTSTTMVRDTVNKSCKISETPAVSCQTAEPGTKCDKVISDKVCTESKECKQIGSTCGLNQVWDKEGKCVDNATVNLGCQLGSTCLIASTSIPGVCNSSRTCIKPGTACDTSSTDNFKYTYTLKGECKSTGECKFGFELDSISGSSCILENSNYIPPSSSQYCWENGWTTSLLKVLPETEEILSCYKGEWVETNPDLYKNSGCFNFANNPSDTSCSYSDGLYCYLENIDTVYSCINSKWTEVDMSDSDGLVVATKLNVVMAGEVCKGTPECMCLNSIETRVAEGDICHTKLKEISPGERCMLTSAEKTTQLEEFCYCQGAPLGINKNIRDGNWCPEVGDCISESSLNKVCRVSGETCKNASISDNACSGEQDISYTLENKKINTGSKCEISDEEEKSGINRCECVGGIDNERTRYDGQWCRDVAILGCDGANFVCTIEGSICVPVTSDNGKLTYKCDSSEDSSNLPNLSKPLISFSNAKVLGQSTTTTSEYIIDSQTGMISNIRAGSYVFEYNNEYYSFFVNETDLAGGNGSVLIFIDVNENGKYDEGTDTKVSDLATTVNIIALEQKFTYKLEQGFNFISVPFLVSNEDSRTAAGLLQKLNSVYGDAIYSISKYDGKWRVVGQNSKVYDNDDFQLIPGQGYIVKAKKRIEISITGKPVQFESASDNASLTLFEGWNLIGMYGTNVKQYTAKSLIQGINASNNPKFTANNVTNWESDVQRYDGFQLDVENGVDIEYGFDFPIKFLQGYFVRVTEGQGNWQPELR